MKVKSEKWMWSEPVQSPEIKDAGETFTKKIAKNETKNKK